MGSKGTREVKDEFCISGLGKYERGGTFTQMRTKVGGAGWGGGRNHEKFRLGCAGLPWERPVPIGCT